MSQPWILENTYLRVRVENPGAVQFRAQQKFGPIPGRPSASGTLKAKPPPPYPANCVAVPATTYQVTRAPLISAPGR